MKHLSRPLLVILLFCLSPLHSQVKIGNNPGTIDANSLLELESSDKGLLMTRVALNSTTSEAPLSAPVPEGMMVYSDGGTLSDGYYYWSGSAWLKFSSTTSRNNFILVKSAADFPAPVGGVITLAANSVYEINGSVTVASKINLNGSYIIGQNVNADRLIYSGSAELFTGTSGGSIKNITLIAAAGKLFNLDATSSPGQLLLVRDCIIAGCANIGTIKGFFITFMDVINFASNTTGLAYENISYLLLNNMAWFPSNTGTYEKLTGSFNTILKLGGFMQPPSGSTALDVSAISSVTASAELKTASFSGSGTLINGTFSKQWEVDAGGLQTEKDGVASGDLYVSSSATTTISNANTPVKVAGTTTATNLFRVTSPVSNRLTYSGTRTRKFKATANVSFTAASNNQEISFYVAKNGTIVPGTQSRRKIGTGSDIGSMALAGIVELAANDYVEIFVENNSSSSNVTVQFMNFSIQ